MSTERARQLRRDPTEAEIRLWSRLRRAQLEGFSFRRQEPIGPYIADFVCYRRRLIVEVDGGQHAADRTRDGVRTHWLEGQGFRVIRFWNNDVLARTDAVVDAVRRALLDHDC